MSKSSSIQIEADRLRLMRRVEVTPTCWLWFGAKRGQGYGCLSYQNRLRYAHHVSWLLHHGPIGGFCVLHRCDNRKCVNPDHLFLGTLSDNSLDGYRKGRIRVPIAEAAAMQRAKTVCKRGHHLSGSNLYISPTDSRVCRTCRLASKRKWEAKRKAALQ